MPTRFNIFLERIMSDALENNIYTVSIKGEMIITLSLAGDINSLAGSEDKLSNVVKHLDQTASTDMA